MSSKIPGTQVDIRIVKLVGTLPGGVLTLFPSPDADDPKMDALLTNEQVADIFNSSPNHFRNVAGTLLPVVKIGGNTRYRLSDVLEYLKNQTRDERKPRQEKAAVQSDKRKKEKRAARRAARDEAAA